MLCGRRYFGSGCGPIQTVKILNVVVNAHTSCNIRVNRQLDCGTRNGHAGRLTTQLSLRVEVKKLNDT